MEADLPVQQSWVFVRANSLWTNNLYGHSNITSVCDGVDDDCFLLHPPPVASSDVLILNVCGKLNDEVFLCVENFFLLLKLKKSDNLTVTMLLEYIGTRRHGKPADWFAHYHVEKGPSANCCCQHTIVLNSFFVWGCLYFIAMFKLCSFKLLSLNFINCLVLTICLHSSLCTTNDF